MTVRNRKQEEVLADANRLAGSGLRQAALDLLLEHLESEPKTPKVLATIGRLYLLEKEYRRAIAYLKESIRCRAPSQGMFAILDIEIVERSHNDLLWCIRLPEQLMAELDTKRSRYDVTLDRLLASNRPDTHMLDLNSFLMQYLLARARSYDFLGLSAVIRSEALPQVALLASILRWQNDQGQRRRQEFTAYGIAPDDSVALNPEAFSEWLKQPAQTGSLAPDREQNQAWFKAAEIVADRRLAEISNRNLHPENNQWVAGAWVARP